MYGREGEQLQIAAAGNAVINRKLRTIEDDRFKEIVDKIRKADISTITLETLLHNYDVYPAAQSGGTYMQSDPSIADELTWAGFNLFSTATNHSYDYLIGGIESTLEELDSRDLSYAGLGRNLADARSPGYIDTPGGRGALVTACSTINSGSEAGEQRKDLQGRPGISPLHLKTVYSIPENDFEKIERINSALGLDELKEFFYDTSLGFQMPDSEKKETSVLNLNGVTHPIFKKDDEYDINREMNQDDVDAILNQIENANKQADWVIASLHSHEGQDGYKNDHTVPPFLEEFARSCIDAGADLFIGHGSMMYRGIELYRDSPIFYGLGNFVMQNELVEKMPSEMYTRYNLSNDAAPEELLHKRNYTEDGERRRFLSTNEFWESILPICTFEDSKLSKIEIYPLTLGFETSKPQRGRPLIAKNETADRIISNLIELSEKYDTQIQHEDGKAVIQS